MRSAEATEFLHKFVVLDDDIPQHLSAILTQKAKRLFERSRKLITLADLTGKEHPIYANVGEMLGNYLLDANSARELDKLFAVHNQKLKPSTR